MSLVAIFGGSILVTPEHLLLGHGKGVAKRLLEKFDEIFDVLKQLLDRLRPSGRYVPFTSGEVTLTSVATPGAHGDYQVHDFITHLGRPARSGTVTNLEGGNLYLAFYEAPERITGKDNEVKVPVGAVFTWEPDDGLEVLKLLVRTDLANTKYQVEAS